ncbi:unnamed protein product [Heterobilharzia americana]|nr:unnamed protein product [Heterobilharzia americana]CAH8543905.1 unnamed protein product [Heterobilharzia americana]
MSLGSEICILKLREEVYLLHKFVEELNERANMKRAYSWKFPGKSAFEIKIHSVLSKCSYSTANRSSNTVMHVFLLEMIIDRCLLIFQILSYICKNDCRYVTTYHHYVNSLTSCVSEHVSVVSALVNAFSVNIEKGENIEEKTIEDCYMESLETEKCVDSKVAAEALKWISDVESFYNNSSQIPPKVASENVDIRHKDQESQTEVCQRKDDDCSLVFSVMIPVLAKYLVKPMDTYNLPSETGRFIQQITNNPRNVCDLDGSKSFFVFLERDLARLMKYFDAHSSSSKVLKDQVNLMKEENTQLSKELIDAQNELNSRNKKLSEQLVELNKKYIEIQEENLKFNVNLEHLNKMLKAKETRINELESQCQVMENSLENLQKLFEVDMNQLTVENSLTTALTIKSGILELQRKLESTSNNCQHISKQLEIKEIENQNMNSQFTMLTTNNEKLSLKINQLTDINEQLENQIQGKNNSLEHLNSELINYKNKVEELENSLNDMKIKLTENEEIKRQIELNLEQTKSINNELCQKLNKLNEDTLNMAQYPDLNGPIVYEDENIGIKSVDEELEGQIQANELRIILLTEQTKRLRNALKLINEKRDNVMTNVQTTEKEDIKLLSTEIDDIILDNISPTTLCKSNSLQSTENLTSENQFIRENNSCLRSKTYTKSKVTSNDVDINYSSNIQLWSGPNTLSTRITKASNRPRSKKIK